jgi:hypothetical protein
VATFNSPAPCLFNHSAKIRSSILKGLQRNGISWLAGTGTTEERHGDCLRNIRWYQCRLQVGEPVCVAHSPWCQYERCTAHGASLCGTQHMSVCVVHSVWCQYVWCTAHGASMCDAQPMVQVLKIYATILPISGQSPIYVTHVS